MKFRLGNRVIRATKCVFRRVRARPRYALGSPPSRNPMAKLITWGQKLKRGARTLCVKNGSGYIRLGADPICHKTPAVPKGHLAVYVAEEDGEFRRVLVPVIYFNDPLFSELLSEAEKEFGFEHPGGITIPCRLTEFERVKTRIASRSGLRGLTRRLTATLRRDLGKLR